MALMDPASLVNFCMVVPLNKKTSPLPPPNMTLFESVPSIAVSFSPLMMVARLGLAKVRLIKVGGEVFPTEK